MEILTDVQSFRLAAASAVSEPSAKRRPILALTGMRAVACLMVVLSHLPVPGLRGASYVFEKSGYSGVTFFFVLSGFVLTYNYFAVFQKLRPREVWNFFVSRVARVYPVYVFAMISVSLWRGYGMLPIDYILALQAWSPRVDIAYGIDGPAWSISVEMFLYVCFPLLILFIHRTKIASSKRRILICACAVGIAMLFVAIVFTLLPAHPITDANSSHRWLYRSPLNRIGDFALGILAAVALLRYPEVLNRHHLQWRVVRYAAAGIVVLMMTHQTVKYIAFLWDVGYAIPFALIIYSLSMAEKSKVVLFLQSKFMVIAGEVSFAFYLVHVPASEMWDRIELTRDGIGVYVAKIIFIAVVATGIHFGLEKPAQKFIKSVLSIRRAHAERLVSPR